MSQTSLQMSENGLEIEHFVDLFSGTPGSCCGGRGGEGGGRGEGAKAPETDAILVVKSL